MSTPWMGRIRRMTKTSRMLAIAGMLGVGLGGCAWMTPLEERSQVLLGAPESQVRAERGEPREIYRLKNGHTRWLYPTQPFGQVTYAAEFDAAGKMVS